MFSEKFQALRKQKGYSQEQFAELLGVSRQAISKWESGQSYPEMNNLIAISQILGLTIDSLVKDEEPQQNVPAPVKVYAYRGEYEYKSKRKLFGIPLVHINLGRGVRKAKGIIAIGNIALGFVALGGISCGLISIGAIGIGLISLCAAAVSLLFSLGAIAIAPLAVGAIAIGFISLGAISIGMFSVGGLAIASHVAIGDHAYGHIAVGRVAQGARTVISASMDGDISSISAAEVRRIINEEFPNLWNWVVYLLTFMLK